MTDTGVDPADPTRPLVYHPHRSTYVESSLAALPADLERMLAPWVIASLRLAALSCD